MRANGIAAFVTAKLDRWKDFFDNIESNPLTPEQRLSVVADEDATLVLAGAGSGKTSVITAKAAYPVKAGIRQPEEILLLAFAKNAAEEMSEQPLPGALHEAREVIHGSDPLMQPDRGVVRCA
ncbi:UvrD-helicase domain-containing protein [Cereibacter johrii]|uniref:UvrD-helicase domain-containing protein n=1 Tax=Cereibacter johrii TaxID=445629 RepID=UPI003CF0AD21